MTAEAITDAGTEITLPKGNAVRSLATVTLGPILAALVSSGIILLLLGVNPLTYYAFVVERGLLSSLGLQQTATRMAPCCSSPQA